MTDYEPIRVLLVDAHTVVRSGLGAFLLAFLCSHVLMVKPHDLVGQTGGVASFDAFAGIHFCFMDFSTFF